MPKLATIDPQASYTFADFFKLHFAPPDILSYFGYSLRRDYLYLPRYSGEWDLKNCIQGYLPRFSLTTEIARWEFLIAPVVIDLLHYTPPEIRVEYPIFVSPQLQGTLDYLLQGRSTLVVIAAKNEDLEQGLVQLAVALIALDRWLDSPRTLIYGAVSTGTIWQLGVLDRGQQLVTQDLNLYRVPADLEDLMPILVAILLNENHHDS
ncbi:MAG: hypothetical protein ACK421_05455 [Pseudanabaenaceae cyanobacterium]